MMSETLKYKGHEINLDDPEIPDYVTAAYRRCSEYQGRYNAAVENVRHAEFAHKQSTIELANQIERYIEDELQPEESEVEVAG